MLPKGAIEILKALRVGPKYFNQLALVRVGSKKVNRRTLAKRLKALEQEKFIFRQVQASRPPRVLYEITERGQRLLEILES